MIREIIFDGIRDVLSENRKVEGIVLGGEAYQELERELSLMPFEELPIREFLSYPIKVLSYLPLNYIALRIKNEI